MHSSNNHRQQNRLGMYKECQQPQLLKRDQGQAIKLREIQLDSNVCMGQAHAEILGNELDDQLVKAVARGKEKAISYSRIPISTAYRVRRKETKMAKKIGKKVQRQPKQNNSFQAYQTDSN
jgi:hypothetical protein